MPSPNDPSRVWMRFRVINGLELRLGRLGDPDLLQGFLSHLRI